MKSRYLEAIKSAGFEGVKVVDESVFPLDCMTNDPSGQAILEGLKVSKEQLKEVEGSVSSIKVSGFKPN
jgi:hypothetical protein